jgi:hypothetical protein
MDEELRERLAPIIARGMDELLDCVRIADAVLAEIGKTHVILPYDDVVMLMRGDGGDIETRDRVRRAVDRF